MYEYAKPKQTLCGVVIVYVVGGISAGLSAPIMVFFALVGMAMDSTDHVRETPEWVEKNYRIPCESLHVKDAIFDMDSNELEVRLEASPPEQFDRALDSAPKTRIRSSGTGGWAGADGVCLWTIDNGRLRSSRTLHGKAFDVKLRREGAPGGIFLLFEARREMRIDDFIQLPVIFSCFA